MLGEPVPNMSEETDFVPSQFLDALIPSCFSA